VYSTQKSPRVDLLDVVGYVAFFVAYTCTVQHSYSRWEATLPWQRWCCLSSCCNPHKLFLCLSSPGIELISQRLSRYYSIDHRHTTKLPDNSAF